MHSEFQLVVAMDDDPYLPKLTSGARISAWNRLRMAGTCDTNLQVS